MDTEKKAALALGAFLTILCLGSFLYLSLPRDEGAEYTADIFQNGTLLFSLPLNKTLESRTFTIESENGGFNEIEISAEGIGILSASCPDRLCVHQGFLQSPGIPIVCLPNRLVIRLRPSSDTMVSDDTMVSGDTLEPDDSPDAVTY